VLRARADADAGKTTLLATFAVAVEGRNIENVSLQLAPSATIDGTVDFQPRIDVHRRPPRSTLRVRAPFQDGTSFADAITGAVDATGSFQVRGVLPGVHTLQVEGLVDPWIVDRTTVRGRNVTDLPVDIASGEHLRDVRIVISDVAATVNGLVRDRGGAPAAGATIVLSPEAAQFRAVAGRRWRILRASFEGRYEIGGVPPGDYRVAAVAGVHEAEMFRHNVLEKILPVAALLTLEPRAVRTLDLPLIYAPGPAGLAR
jgi:hypothetical protein